MENIINVAEKKLGIEEFNTLKDKLNRFGLIVRKIEHGDATLPYSDMPIKSGVFSIVLVKKGNSVISINDSEHEISDNSLIFILPNYILKHKIHKQINASGYVIILSIDFLINVQIKTEFIIPIFLKFYNNPIVKLTDKEIDILCKYFDLLSIEESENISNTSTLISSGIITSLIYRLSNIFDSKGNNIISDNKTKSNIRIFKEFLQLAIKEFRTHREITYYANALCVTPKYLSTIVKEVSKNKASKWIELLVITEAKSLLKYSDMTIQEIAYNLNFANPSFFGAYFKKYAGLTPGEYRKS
ncbi:MAG: helix-turn-helix domain-containing protein [Bacteroidales bacterium]|nr:helix-turn-helix domain-containing protein [Bacteroidales bacterium]